ncbi:unnamed protein product [Symbiodinium sp. CCMP2592]|nr:unnamed protein product [Symbiodinium sp. CCMP2592]
MELKGSPPAGGVASNLAPGSNCSGTFTTMCVNTSRVRCQQTLILQLAQTTRPKPKLVTILSRCLRRLLSNHRESALSALTCHTCPRQAMIRTAWHLAQRRYLVPLPLSALPDAGITEPTAPPRQPAAREPQVMRTLEQHEPWDAMQQCPHLQEELLHHCCLCRQWTPARGGTKIHLRGSHAKEWEQAGKAAEHNCLNYASFVTSSTGCPFCLAPKFADKRAARAHAQNCQVLFQLVFLRILRQPSPGAPAREQQHLVLQNGDKVPVAIAVPVQSRPTPEQSEFLLRHCWGSNPLKRPKPDPEIEPRGKGRGTGKGKGKTKSPTKQGTQPRGVPWGKGKWPQWTASTWDTPSWPSAQGLNVEAAIYAMAKLCLRQETELSELRQEKSFMLHVSAGPHGILKPLIQASLKWNELRDQMKVDCSLKSELFSLMIKETAARMMKFEQTPESIAGAEKAKWVTNQPLTWLYQKWDPEAHLLVLDKSRKGMQHQDVKTLLDTMIAALKEDPEALNQFTAKRRLTESMSGASVAFKVTVGLRSPQCQILYDALAKLAGLAVLQLIAANMHKERQKHGREAEEEGMPHGMLGALGTRLQALLTTTRPVVLRDLPIIQDMMRWWAHPLRQHDIAEFFSHFVSFCCMPFGQACWEARDIRGPALHVLDEGTLQTPIPLHIPASRAEEQLSTFQDCVEQFFRGQRCGCALASAAPLLCFQLKRYVFNERTGAVRKLAMPIRFDEPSLQVPIWEDESTLRIKYVRYQVNAIAFHEGRTPYAGHYRTCLLHQGCLFVTDDNTEARRTDPQILQVVQSNSYLFLCTLQSASAVR